MATTGTTNTPIRQPRLLELVREALRLRHYSLRTEQAYAYWVKRFVLFHSKRHPREMGAAEVASFLSWLAVAGQVSAASLVIWHGVDFNAVHPMVTPTTIALAMSPFSVYCTFIQYSPKEASHGTPSFCIAVLAQDGGHSGLWHADWPLAGTSGQRLSARPDVLYGVCGTSADSANGHLPAHRTRPTRHGAFYRAAVINCAGQKWL